MYTEWLWSIISIISYVYLCAPMASIQMTAMMQGNYTEVFRQKSFFKVELLRTDAFTRGAFTHRSFYTEGPVHTDAFTTQQLWHRGACTHRSYYTEELLHTDAFTQRIFCTEKLLHTDAFTHKRSYTQEAFTQAAFTRRTLATKDLCNANIGLINPPPGR